MKRWLIVGLALVLALATMGCTSTTETATATTTPSAEATAEPSEEPTEEPEATEAPEESTLPEETGVGEPYSVSIVKDGESVELTLTPTEGSLDYTIAYAADSYQFASDRIENNDGSAYLQVATGDASLGLEELLGSEETLVPEETSLGSGDYAAKLVRVENEDGAVTETYVVDLGETRYVLTMGFSADDEASVYPELTAMLNSFTVTEETASTDETESTDETASTEEAESAQETGGAA